VLILALLELDPAQPPDQGEARREIPPYVLRQLVATIRGAACWPELDTAAQASVA
jgi:hypothetical protein